MNWKTFYALLSRDGHVARRNLVFTLVQNLLQPLLLTFVFGRVLTAGGMMQAGYKNVAHMKKDADLDPLRQRDDFQKLLAALDEQG